MLQLLEKITRTQFCSKTKIQKLFQNPYVHKNSGKTMNPKDMEIEYQGVKTTIGKLTIEQAQDLIFELLNEKENVNEILQKMFLYGRLHSLQEEETD